MSDCEKLARFLRARAERFRRIAMMHDTPFSERLLDDRQRSRSPGRSARRQAGRASAGRTLMELLAAAGAAH